MHISCIHHLVIGPILADLIGLTFCHFCQVQLNREKTNLFFSQFSLQLAISLSEVTGQLMERVGSAS